MKKSKYIEKIKKAEYFKLFAGILVGMLLASPSIYYAATTYYSGDEVSYNNANTGIDADNVQDALDFLGVTASEGFLDRIYPVGSIFISTNLSSVSAVESTLGGTWEVFGSGTTLVSANSSYPANTTGGSVSESYTPTGLNSDTAITFNTETLNHSGMGITFNTVTLAHSGGGVGATALSQAQLPKMTGTITLHNILDPNNSNNFTFVHGVTGCFASSINTNSNKYAALSPLGTPGAPSIGVINYSFGSGSTHTHTFTRPNSHSYTPSVKSYTNPTAHSYTPTVESYTNPTFTGTEATISHMQPYITVYMYRRKS